MNEGVVFDTIFVDYFVQKFRLQFFTRARKETMEFFCEFNRQLMLHNPASRKQETADVVEELEALAKFSMRKSLPKKNMTKRKKI